MAKRKKGAKGKKQDAVARGALTLTKQYVKGTSNAGSVSLNCGDSTAKQLSGMALEDVYGHAAEQLGESAASLKKRYGKLNPGMQRMNLGNRLRKLARAA